MPYSYAPQETKNLITLHKLTTKQDFNVEYYYSITNSSIQNADRIINEILEVELVVILNDIPRSNIPDWADLIEDQAAQYNLEPLPLLSTVLTTRSIGVKTYKKNNTIIVVTSNELYAEENTIASKFHMIRYRQILAAMMVLRNDDKEFVERAANALSSKQLLTYTEEEIKLIDKHLKDLKTQQIKDHFKSITVNHNLEHEIENQRYRVEELENRVERAQRELLRLTMENYANQFRSEGMEEALDELMEYMDESDSILNINTNHNRMEIKLKTYLRTSDEDVNFVHTDSVSNPNHQLHNKHKAIYLLRKSINNEIRIPITADYLIVPNGDRIMIEGREVPVPRETDYTTNGHVNHYNCFSAYRAQAQDALIQKDFIGFFEILLQCTGTMNLYDTGPARRFINTLDTLKPSAVIQVKTDQGWVDMTLRDYGEQQKINFESSEIIIETSGDVLEAEEPLEEEREDDPWLE